MKKKIEENSVSEEANKNKEKESRKLALIEKEKKIQAEQAKDWKNRFTEDVTYKFYNDGSCKNMDKEKCVSLSDYKLLCEKAKISGRISRFAIAAGGGSYSDRVFSHLARNGTLTGLKIDFKNKLCGVIIYLSGIYKGSSYNKTGFATASGFRISNDGVGITMLFDGFSM